MEIEVDDGPVRPARGGPLREFPDRPGRPVHRRLVEGSVPDRVHDLRVGAVPRAGHLEIQAGGDRPNAVGDRTPV